MLKQKLLLIIRMGGNLHLRRWSPWGLWNYTISSCTTNWVIGGRSIGNLVLTRKKFKRNDWFTIWCWVLLLYFIRKVINWVFRVRRQDIDRDWENTSNNKKSVQASTWGEGGDTGLLRGRRRSRREEEDGGARKMKEGFRAFSFLYLF